MSLRNYLISAVVVVVFTVIASWWKQKKTAREVFVIFCQVLLLLGGLLGAVYGLAKLLEVLGIAQSGFIIQEGELK
ncbi:hypothetical protein UR09_01400 [Candidatus Nitromaritima sp. SCGC AAA799-A02]|nr:hypothetical protein UR09_01400 [Candidatus Nitromaritima sp. SCGC AAA799-A02]